MPPPSKAVLLVKELVPVIDKVARLAMAMPPPSVAVLLLNVPLLTFIVPVATYIPPPLKAELFAKLQLVRFAAPEVGALLYTPPPLLPTAFELKLTSEAFRVAPLKIPPPSVAVLPTNPPPLTFTVP